MNAIEVNHTALNSFMLSELIGKINNEFGDPIKEYKFSYCKKDGLLLCNVVLAPQFKKWEATIKEHLILLLEKKFKDICLIIKIEIVKSICNNGIKYRILDII